MRPASSWRRSITSTRGQPSRSMDREGVSSGPAARASSDGHGEASTQGTPARRARSTATSRACQEGVCSCLWASSCSSRTSTAARSTTGAQAAERGPMTRAPPRAWAHSSGWTATGTPARRRRTPRSCASSTVGRSTRALPRRQAARTSGNRSAPGARRTTVGPDPAKASSARSSPVVGTGCDGTHGSGTPVTARSGEAVRRNDTTGPAQRWAAHRARSTRSSGGPQPVTLARGRSTVPSGGRDSSSVTHPPTRRPCSSMRTRVPTATRSASSSGTR